MSKLLRARHILVDVHIAPCGCDTSEITDADTGKLLALRSQTCPACLGPLFERIEHETCKEAQADYTAAAAQTRLFEKTDTQ